jgi:hypothetical protein
MVVEMVPIVLRELYVSFSLREDKRNIDGHKKKDIRGLLKQEKKKLSQYDSFMGYTRRYRELLAGDAPGACNTQPPIDDTTPAESRGVHACHAAS